MSDVPSELTTAATDAAIALLCAVALQRLLVLPVNQRWKRSIWAWVLACLGMASLVGAAVHAIVSPPLLRTALWAMLYASLGLTLAAFLVGVLFDARGESLARSAAPWVAAGGTGFGVLTIVSGGSFAVFVAIESVVMIAGLVVYGALALTRRLPGAGLVAVGIVVTVLAGVVQTSRFSLVLFVPFDHNGLFHLVQLVGTILLVMGIRRGLSSTRGRPTTEATLLRIPPPRRHSQSTRARRWRR